MNENQTNKNILTAGPYRTWGIPLFLLACMAVILWNDTNIDVFFIINGFSGLTGEKLWALLTFFSDGLVTFVILLPWIRSKPRIVWAVLMAALISTVFIQAIKHLAQVPRPPDFLAPEHFNLIGPGWTSNSFPSGHASMVFVLAGVFFFTTSKIWLRPILLVLASLVAMSRIVVGVHWPLDVLAGVVIGWISIWIALKLSYITRWAWTAWRPKIIGAILLAGCVLLFFMDYTGYEHVLTEQRIIAVVFFIIGSFEYIKLYRMPLK
jgi:membrane-associated phospholipid phosphatase